MRISCAAMRQKPRSWAAIVGEACDTMRRPCETVGKETQIGRIQDELRRRSLPQRALAY